LRIENPKVKMNKINPKNNISMMIVVAVVNNNK
jgi:hypothetical protein